MEVEGKRIDEVILDELCELCLERNANGYCKECELRICKTCFENHLKAKPCRDHVLTASLSVTGTTEKKNDETTYMAMRGNHEVIDVTARDNDEIKCDTHVQETVRFYCTKHEIVGCGDCIFLNHKKCDVEYIKDITDRYMTKDRSDSFRTKLEQIEEEVECGIENVKTYQENNATCNKTALENIHKSRQEIDSMLDIEEGKLCTETNELHNKNASALSKLLDSYGNVRMQYHSLKESLSCTQHHPSKDFINTVRAKPLISVLEKSLKELKANTKSLMYHFQSNPSFKVDLGYLHKGETSDCKETTQDRGKAPLAERTPDKEEHAQEWFIDSKTEELREASLVMFSDHQEFPSDSEELKKDKHDANPNSSIIKDWNLCVKSITLSSENEQAQGIIEGNGGEWKITSSKQNWLQLEIQAQILIHRLCLRAKMGTGSKYLSLVVKGGDSVGSLRKIRSLEIDSYDGNSPVTLIQDCELCYLDDVHSLSNIMVGKVPWIPELLKDARPYSTTKCY